MHLAIAVACLFELLVYTGFCFKHLRYIPDEEKIRIAIEYVLKENRKMIVEYKDRVVVYPFTTVDEFLSSEPSICDASNSLRGGAGLDR